MSKIALAAAAAAAIATAAPWSIGAVPAKADNLQIAQAGVEVQIGHDRDDVRRRRNEDSRTTIGVGPSGVVVGPQRCRTVTTTVERDDGRTVTRKERRCD